MGWELELTFEVNKQMTADCDVTICLLPVLIPQRLSIKLDHLSQRTKVLIVQIHRLNKYMNMAEVFTAIFGKQTAENPDGLSTFREMWTHLFIWCVASSILFYTMAAALAFFTLGKHKFGR